jgi:hypothetical protein
MLGPILAEVDVLNASALRDCAIQRAVIDSQVLLVEFRF